MRVLQPLAGLSEWGLSAGLFAEAASARCHAGYDAALCRLRALGTAVITAEMALFEWMQFCGHPWACLTVSPLAF